MFGLLTLHPDVRPGFSQHVAGGAGIVSKVLEFHGSDEKRMSVALLLHVAPAIGVEEHRVLVPEDVRGRLGIDDADQLHLVAHATVDRGMLRFDFRLV